jgi:hypothetical protein
MRAQNQTQVGQVTFTLNIFTCAGKVFTFKSCVNFSSMESVFHRFQENQNFIANIENGMFSK